MRGLCFQVTNLDRDEFLWGALGINPYRRKGRITRRDILTLMEVLKLEVSIFFSFIHMCIQCLGHFSPLPLPPPSPPYTLATRQKLFCPYL
jgi:hypothetical protein